MGAATITTEVWNWCHVPGIEIVLLTASDGDTYVSKKFATVDAAIPAINEDDERDICCARSGNTVTIHSTGLSSKKVALLLFGKK